MTFSEQQTKIQSYVETWETIRGMVGDDQAASAILAELAKDRRVQEMRAERQAGRASGKDAPEQPLATEKQIAFLADLGMKVVPDGLTRERASELIEQQKRLKRDA